MGLFDYSKNGPGVSKDSPQKKGIFLFFELLGRKIGKLCQMNMLYFLVSIPMIAISFIAANFFITYSANILHIENVTDNVLFPPLCTFVTFMFITLLGSGPASASLSYLNRCIVREKGIFLVSDFFEQFKINFKQGMIVGILNPIITFVLLFVILFYAEMYIRTNSMFVFLCMLLLIVVSFIFVFSTFYIYQLMITFKNSIFQLYKNSIILALVNLPMNVFFFLIIFIINGSLFTPLNPAITIILSFICWIAIMRFIIEFYTSRIIQKKIINNIEKED